MRAFEVEVEIINGKKNFCAVVGFVGDICWDCADTGIKLMTEEINAIMTNNFTVNRLNLSITIFVGHVDLNLLNILSQSPFTLSAISRFFNFRETICF